jgi:hypothetical protein
LIDHDHAAELLPAADAAHASGFILADLAAQLLQVPVEHVVHERGFAGAADAGDADEGVQRDVRVEFAEVVLAGGAIWKACL